MKILITLLAALLLAGCGEAMEPDRLCTWVVERRELTGSEIQEAFDVMGRFGWIYECDDDLEKSGHYVYFRQYIKIRKAEAVLVATAEAMAARRGR